MTAGGFTVKFVLLFSTSYISLVFAIPRNQFYPFGESAGDVMLPPNDDGSSPPITLQGGVFPYFGQSRTTLYVSTVYNSL